MDEIGARQVKEVLDYLRSKLPSRNECVLQLKTHEYLDALSYATDHLPPNVSEVKPEQGIKSEQIKKRVKRN